MKTKRIAAVFMTVLLMFSISTTCFADELADWQAAQNQVMVLTAQVQQYTVLAQSDPSLLPILQTLQMQLAQAQQTAAALQPAATQILLAQQAQALQLQQAQALQAQQTQALQLQQAQALQIQQAQALQLQQAQQAQALQLQRSLALQSQQTSAPVSYGTVSASDNTIAYISATGTCYHRIPNCGKMNPNKAVQTTVGEAKKICDRCSKCW